MLCSIKLIASASADFFSREEDSSQGAIRGVFTVLNNARLHLIFVLWNTYFIYCSFNFFIIYKKFTSRVTNCLNVFGQILTFVKLSVQIYTSFLRYLCSIYLKI